MVSEQEVIELVISLLENNITDPATERSGLGKKWIYDDNPREDISSYPRIAVIPVNSIYSNFTVGYTKQLEEMTISIQIFSKKTDKFGGKRAEQLVDDLAIQIRNLIRNNHSYFITNSIQHLIPETKNRIEKEGLVIEQMTFKAMVVN